MRVFDFELCISSICLDTVCKKSSHMILQKSLWVPPVTVEDAVTLDLARVVIFLSLY